MVRAQFFGLGSDGTVGANKESIKIIGENTDNFAQGYFVYDSKKSGAMTISHLRFGPRPIRSTYLITSANFVACHQPFLLETYDVLKDLAPGGTFLLNSPFGPDRVWEHLPENAQRRIIEQSARFFVIDANKVARESGMGGRINTVMQTCFFAISGVLPPEEAIEAIKNSIRKTYGKKGEEIVEMNLHAVDETLAHLHEVEVPREITAADLRAERTAERGAGVRAQCARRNHGGARRSRAGERVAERRHVPDRHDAMGKAQSRRWKFRSGIRAGLHSMRQMRHGLSARRHSQQGLRGGACSTARRRRSNRTRRDCRNGKGCSYTLQVAVEDCTGCGICVDVCPARNKSEARLKAINMQPQPPLRETERENWNFFLSLPELDRRKVPLGSVREMQVQQPLFEFSGACAGCGETPYIKLLTQLFGDRLIIANATGCSSIYGGNLPTTPYAKNSDGRGPAWCNSLFEDNAEFGLGFRVSIDKQQEFAGELLQQLAPQSWATGSRRKS